MISQEKGDIEKALEFYQIVLLKNSKFYKALMSSGIIYLMDPKLKDLKKAHRLLEEALKFEEDSDIL